MCDRFITFSLVAVLSLPAPYRPADA